MQENKFNPFAKQIMIDFYQCSLDIINNTEKVRNYFADMFHHQSEYVVEDMFHVYHEYGMSGTMITPKTRVSLHAVPEKRLICVDYFYIGDIPNYKKQIRDLKNFFGASHYTIMEFNRGQIPPDNKLS